MLSFQKLVVVDLNSVKNALHAEMELKKLSQNGFISFMDAKNIAKLTNFNLLEVEQIALKNDILPIRYKRNAKTISISEQLKLSQSKALIVGCGGLGGFAAEFLARLGVGNISLMDGDIFDEHNLNRQNFSTISSIGKPKAKVVASSLKRINPATCIKTINRFFDCKKDEKMVLSYDIVIDALDCIKTKRELFEICKKYDKPFIHAAIGGLMAEVSVDKLLYANNEQGVEVTLGNPIFTASLAASLQAFEAFKVLTGRESLGQMLMVDLENYEFVGLP